MINMINTSIHNALYVCSGGDVPLGACGHCRCVREWMDGCLSKQKPL